MTSCMLAALAIAAIGQAEPPKPLRFVAHSWRAESGLPGDQVVRIAHTRQGYLYVGTTNGLARHVGGGEYGPLFGKSSVLALIEDREGGFWVGTDSGRVLRLSRGSLLATD